MPVLINFKICDNAKECGGVEVCPTGAFYWDEEEKTIAIDNERCTNCGLCEKACPVGAIRFARTEDEYQNIEKEIEEDQRRMADLFVDRYGAEPIDPDYIVSEEDFELEIRQHPRLTAVEFFSEDSIECLLNSIPIKELFENLDEVKYRCFEIKDNKYLEQYEIETLPALLFFKNGNLVGKIEGYYQIEDKNRLQKRIEKLLDQK